MTCRVFLNASSRACVLNWLWKRRHQVSRLFWDCNARTLLLSEHVLRVVLAGAFEFQAVLILHTINSITGQLATHDRNPRTSSFFKMFQRLDPLFFLPFVFQSSEIFVDLFLFAKCRRLALSPGIFLFKKLIAQWVEAGANIFGASVFLKCDILSQTLHVASCLRKSLGLVGWLNCCRH